MSGTERRVSATEARVRFGELLDGVTARHDVVFLERAGKEVAVVVSVEDWEVACASRSNKWTRANAIGPGPTRCFRSCMSRLRAEGAIERLQEFDVEEAIRVGTGRPGRAALRSGAVTRAWWSGSSMRIPPSCPGGSGLCNRTVI